MHNAAKHSATAIKKKRFSKKSLIPIVIIAIILIGGFWFVYNSSGKNISGNVVNQKAIQKITLSLKGDYYPNNINVKSGVPVEITLDSSVRGCYRSFSIPDLGVAKHSSSSTDTINFTPNQKGTFRFQCSMGMGTGTLIVK